MIPMELAQSDVGCSRVSDWTFVTKILTESVSGKAADLERGVLCWQGVLAPLPDCLYEDILGKFVTQPLHAACIVSACSLQYFISLQYYIIYFSIIVPFSLEVS